MCRTIRRPKKFDADANWDYTGKLQGLNKAPFAHNCPILYEDGAMREKIKAASTSLVSRGR